MCLPAKHPQIVDEKKRLESVCWVSRPFLFAIFISHVIFWLRLVHEDNWPFCLPSPLIHFDRSAPLFFSIPSQLTLLQDTREKKIPFICLVFRLLSIDFSFIFLIKCFCCFWFFPSHSFFSSVPWLPFVLRLIYCAYNLLCGVLVFIADELFVWLLTSQHSSNNHN